MKIKHIVLLMFVCNILIAHNSNEIIYKVTVNQQQQQLTINLTSLAVKNLLQQLHPDLKSGKELQLENYLNEFEAYFNKTIDLNIDTLSVQFKLVDHQFEEHDAKLTFTLQNLPVESSQFEITITSFLTVYDRVMNIVRVDLNGEKTNCILDNTIRTCATPNRDILVNFLRTILFYVVMPLALSLILLFFFRRKKSSISQEES